MIQWCHKLKRSERSVTTRHNFKHKGNMGINNIFLLFLEFGCYVFTVQTAIWCSELRLFLCEMRLKLKFTQMTNEGNLKKGSFSFHIFSLN